MTVYNLAGRNVQRLMTLIYRTLQRPCDLLKLESKNIVQRAVNGKMVEVLSLKQSKTGAIVEIIMSDDMKDAIYSLNNDGTYIPNTTNSKYFILNREGEPYTTDGMNSNFANAQNKYRDQIKKVTGVRPIPFGLYDLKGKGATDMYQNGIALEYIQALAGHESVRTTEIYIKARLNKPVTSNLRIIGS
jgi:site-specific recombinase XerD